MSNANWISQCSTAFVHFSPLSVDKLRCSDPFLSPGNKHMNVSGDAFNYTRAAKWVVVVVVSKLNVFIQCRKVEFSSLTCQTLKNVFQADCFIFILEILK